MKARTPNANQGGNMMQKLQKMQEEMAKTQSAVEESEFSASAGGGAVEPRRAAAPARLRHAEAEKVGIGEFFVLCLAVRVPVGHGVARREQHAVGAVLLGYHVRVRQRARAVRHGQRQLLAPPELAVLAESQHEHGL